MFRRIYHTHFKSKLFNKLIFIYSCIALVSLVTLSVLTYQFFVRKEVNSVLLEQQRTVDGVNRYFDQKHETAQMLVQQLYQDNALIQDTVFFLENGYEAYVRNRLDSYSDSSSFLIRDFHLFYSNQFLKDTNIKNIILASHGQQFNYMYSNKGTSRAIYPSSNGMNFSENFWKDRSSAAQSSYFTVKNRLNNPDTLMMAGEILIDFGTEGIHEHSTKREGEKIIVLDESNNIIYPSEPDVIQAFETNKADLMNMPRNQPTFMNVEGWSDAYVTLSQTNKQGMTVIAMLPEKGITGDLAGIRTTIAIVTVLSVILVVTLTYLSVLRVSRRTQSILRAMRKVRIGGLDTRIKFAQDDELAEIARSFNLMVSDLSTYINRVYKSELKQKHAELVAMQAQIKPHFLYNTLEVIRMRAVAQGAHDVGDMIYNLASIFRHMVKDKSHITLNEEIENCKRYLELTRIRYRDKMKYTVTMDPSLGGYQFMNLSVQPIIENYLVHGLRLDRSDNHIFIEALKDEKHIIIRVSDNGKGILPERLCEIQEDLGNDNLNDRGSLGLKNVHNRLRILYGDEAGLLIDSQENEGTTVMIRIPV